MKKSKNIVKEKLSPEELEVVSGTTVWVCDTEMPAGIKCKPRSSVYYAWLLANCVADTYCAPTTWNICY